MVERQSFGHLPGSYIASYIALSYDGSSFGFLRNIYININRHFTNLYFGHHCIGPPISTPSPAFIIFCLIDDSHYDWSEMEFQSHFNLRFPGG